MLHYLAIGTVLGLSAGFAPGPLLTLVIAETLQHDVKSGVKVALAPIVTDLPIILLTWFVLSRLSGFHAVLGAVSLAGGCFVLYMGYESMRTRGVDTTVPEAKPKSLAKGVLANALSPHPYLFWLSVGAPTVIKATSVSATAPVAFLVGFYACLVGAKITLALVVGRSKSFLKGNAYIYILRALGLMLCGLAVFLFYDGLKLLKLV